MKTSGSKSPRDRINKTVLEVPRSGIRDFFDIVSTRDDVISLGIGEPDFDTPWHVREAAVFALEKGGAVSHYTSNMGLIRLRKALSSYVAQFFGMEYDPEKEILVTVGVSEAMDLAIRAVTEPGDEVLYHEPAFVSYAPLVAFAGGKPVAVETSREDGFQLTRERLEEKVTDRTKVLMLNYPNNPTGATITPEGLAGIADFAKEHDLLVITDEIYAELTYEGTHTSIITMPGMRERTIFLHGFSKTWAMTGFRMGYACAIPELTEAMMKIHQYSMMSAPTPSQAAACSALTDCAEDIEYMRGEYLKRRNFLCSSFEDMGLPCVKPGGAFYVFPYIGECGLSSYDFAMRFLEEQAVAMVPGTAFGACGEGYIRGSYATSMDDLKEAITRLKSFIASL
jgi:aminotransferase